MKAVTTKLKRYKILNTILLIIFLPLVLPMSLLIKLGEGSNWFFDHIIYPIVKFIRKVIVKVFKWDDIAIARYKSKEHSHE